MALYMVLNQVYLIPHGDEILDLPNAESRIMHDAISNLAKKDDSEVIVIISPHGLKLGKHVSVLNTESFKGYFKLKSKTLDEKYINDRALSRRIIHDCPLAEEASFVTSSGPDSVFPLDFGTLIPLQFFRQKTIVYMGQPRIWYLNSLRDFGKEISKICMDYEKKVSIVISADQAHCHFKDGPYGYAPESAKYEEIVINCIRKSNFSPLHEMSMAFVDKAKPDSYWNMIILEGIMDETGMRSVFDYHYVQVYFGMLLAHLAH
ncbi:MAG: DODA-type extradiol aromatic ring-opening family dioxygenase [Cuniculiplasma sp.]|jgi:aromatic ring-opening dioxygenase LigB subunit